MSYYVYLIQSVGTKKNKTYVGYTNNLKEEFHFIMIVRVQRQQEVLSGNCYTKKFYNKSGAMSYEYKIKKTDC